jgi:hypothetical protein
MIGICNVVFGLPFVGLWNEVCLPSELSPSNVKALNSRGRARYIIYTNQESARFVEQCVRQRGMRDHFDVDVNIFELNMKNGAHGAMTWSHQHCISHYKDKVEGLIFSSADDCYHEGYYQQVVDQAVAKGKACITFAVRVSLSCLPDLEVELKQGELSYEKAVSFLHRFIHPLHQDQVVERSHIRSRHPAVLFEYREEVLTMRGFHMHPMYVPARLLNVAFKDTIDGEFVETVGRDRENYVVMGGVNAPFVLSLTPDSKYADIHSDRRIDIKHILKWIFKNTNSIHKDFYVENVFVTSLSRRVSAENMRDFSPQLTALQKVVERTARKPDEVLGCSRYSRPVVSTIRALTLYWSIARLREQMRIRRRSAGAAARKNGHGPGPG